MKVIRKIGAKFSEISKYSKCVLALCVVIVITTVYVCNSINVNGKEKETGIKEVSIINIKEKEDELVATAQVQMTDKIEQVKQASETEQVEQPVETEQVEQSAETQQVEQSVEIEQVSQPAEIQKAGQSEETGQMGQTSEPEQEVVTNTNIHKNSINGIEYKLMNQADAEWKDVKYPTRSGTIGEVGCMITSAAVVSSAYDKTMTPKKVMDAGYQHNYPSDSIPYFSANNYTCTMSSSPNKNTIIDNLKQGNVVVIKVKSASKFTTSQHYMALIDIKSDGSQIFVGNSYGSGTGTYNRAGWFATDTVLYDVRETHICVPSQNLINQYK